MTLMLMILGVVVSMMDTLRARAALALSMPEPPILTAPAIIAATAPETAPAPMSAPMTAQSTAGDRDPAAPTAPAIVATPPPSAPSAPIPVPPTRLRAVMSPTGRPIWIVPCPTGTCPTR